MNFVILNNLSLVYIIGCKDIFLKNFEFVKRLNFVLGNIVLEYVGREPGHNDQYIYSGLNAKMNILYQPGVGMSGILKHDKQTFLLENCQELNFINWKGH